MAARRGGGFLDRLAGERHRSVTARPVPFCFGPAYAIRLTDRRATTSYTGFIGRRTGVARRPRDQPYKIVVEHVEDERAEEDLRWAFDFILRAADRCRGGTAQAGDPSRGVDPGHDDEPEAPPARPRAAEASRARRPPADQGT